MSDLTLAAAVDHCMTATALLELHLTCRLVQLIELAGGVGASYELSGQLHVHPVIHSQGKLRYTHAVIKAVLDEEVDKRALRRLLRDTAVEEEEDLDPHPIKCQRLREPVVYCYTEEVITFRRH